VSHGSVKLNGDGTLTFTPTAGFSGQTTYSYTVTSGGVTETATETIQVGANQAPTATGNIASVTEDTPVGVPWEAATSTARSPASPSPPAPAQRRAS
jgi:hypothetical protein